MTTASAASLSPDVWRPLDTALWCYFFLPVAIFLLGFFVVPVGVPAALTALVAAVFWLPRRPTLGVPPPRRDAWLSVGLLALLAAVWSVLGGAGHVFQANAFDWVPRFAVLRDLVVLDWPPRYVDAAGRELILRAPLGYYLPTAWLAHAAGLAWADAILLLWTWLGVALFFAANFRGTPRQVLAAAALFAMASGLDVVGALQTYGRLPPPGMHIEWWARDYQYSSNSTLLFWVPNHALPGWIAAAWLWRFRADPRFVARLPILFLPVMLWSPLPAIGLLPLALVLAYSHWRRGQARWREFFKSLALVAPAAGLVAAFLLLSAGAIDAGVGAATRAQPQAAATAIDIWKPLHFFMLEAGMFGLLAVQRERSPLLLASLALLAALPWFHFGPNNDLAMRGSIPALTILWLVLIDELTAPPPQRALSPALHGLLLLLWLLGIATPFQEIYRALAGTPWAPNTTLSAPTALHGFPSHYFAPLAGSVLKPLFRN